MSNNSLHTGNFQKPDSVIGTPDQDHFAWDGRQGYDDTCAIRAQEYILQLYTGEDFDEDMLIQEAMDHDWYTPGDGTAAEDVGNLLELHGIPVNRYTDANVFQLANELAQGHKVIVGVDADDLWRQHRLLERIQESVGIDPGGNHAVVVSGIDTLDPNNIQVIVNDPGTGEALARYPMDQFLKAWKDSDFFMVATQEPAPQWVPEMVNFDYDMGHIDEVAGVPYEQFVTLEDQPEIWNDLFERPAHSSIEFDSGMNTALIDSDAVTMDLDLEWPEYQINNDPDSIWYPETQHSEFDDLYQEGHHE